MPSLSVIIPAYVNSPEQADWLHEAMQSVISQSFTDRELIIVDDGSSHDLLVNEDIEYWRVIRHDRRRGAGAARNTGIAAAKGEYVLCLDADDRLKPGALKTLWDARCSRGVVYGDLEYVGDRQGVHPLPTWSVDILMRGQSPLPITSLFPREAWRSVGGFDESLPGLEDVDFWIKLAERGICGLKIPGVIFEYRRHANSRQATLQGSNNVGMRQVVEMIQARYRRIAVDMAAIQAKCSKCPGAGGVGQGVKQMMDDKVGPDTVQVRYIGPMLGSFTAHGFATGAKYFINGRGDTITVDVRDVEGLLKRHTGGQRDFEQLALIATPVKEVAVNLGNDSPPPNLAHISDLTVKEAEALIADTAELPDLIIWLAEERASEAPRKGILTPLEARIAELQK
jgi:hypothetical protein